METTTLLKANMKRHKGSLAGIFILMLLVAAALGTVLTVWSNSGKYIQSEMQRAGFGELTAWVSGVPDMKTLTDTDLCKLYGERTGIGQRGAAYYLYPAGNPLSLFCRGFIRLYSATQSDFTGRGLCIALYGFHVWNKTRR